MFEAGLRSYPDNALLNFNAAVTYGELHADDDARRLPAAGDRRRTRLRLALPAAQQNPRRQGRYSVATWGRLYGGPV